MARTVTLEKLRGLARLYADQRPGGANAFVPDTGAPSVGTLNDLINLAGTELWDLLVLARGHDYHLKDPPGTLSVVAGTSQYSLPADFYELRNIVLKWSVNEIEEVKDIAHLGDRSDLINFRTWAPWAPKAFRVLETKLEILPTPTSVVTGELWYIPTWKELTVDSDTFDGVNGWDKLIALRAAIELRVIDKLPAGDLQMLFAETKQRIEEMASERQAAFPKTVRDVAPEAAFVWPFVRRRDA